MMNLVIDCGNTRIKWAFFKNRGVIHEHGIAEYVALDSIQKKIEQASGIVLSDVSGRFNHELLAMQQSVINLTSSTPLPIVLDYHTPETLGNDRIAAAVGAHFEYPNHNCLVIDAGTCITVDLTTKNGVYTGGSIAPGLQMRLNAMHHFTGQLPRLTPDRDFHFHGKSTKTCMLSGAIDFTLLEIDAVIQRYSKSYKNLRVILTGGDAEFLAKGLKSNTFADLFLVEKGLNEILRFNS